MIGLIQKIALSILTVALTGFLGYFIFSISTEPNYLKDPWMLLPLALILLGVCSFIFHLKKILYFKNSSRIEINYSKNTVLWYTNLAYGITVICLAFIFAYQFSSLYERNIETEFVLLSIIVLSTFVFGVWVCMDYYN